MESHPRLSWQTNAMCKLVQHVPLPHSIPAKSTGVVCLSDSSSTIDYVVCCFVLVVQACAMAAVADT